MKFSWSTSKYTSQIFLNPYVLTGEWFCMGLTIAGWERKLGIALVSFGYINPWL